MSVGDWGEAEIAAEGLGFVVGTEQPTLPEDRQHELTEVVMRRRGTGQDEAVTGSGAEPAFAGVCDLFARADELAAWNREAPRDFTQGQIAVSRMRLMLSVTLR